MSDIEGASAVTSEAGAEWLISNEQTTVTFHSRDIERAFVARVLLNRLFAAERPDLKVAGLRPLDLETSRVIASGIQDSPDRRAKLDGWQHLDRTRRSLFRGADAAMLARNLALVRIALVGECRGLDLSDADFTGLDLSGADFSGAILTGASFRSTTLKDSRFAGAQLDGADFTGSTP